MPEVFANVYWPTTPLLDEGRACLISDAPGLSATSGGNVLAATCSLARCPCISWGMTPVNGRALAWKAAGFE
eukprot:scaffold2995_cov430-Prasinococcus_capsulatus_cf.AAC.3